MTTPTTLCHRCNGPTEGSRSHDYLDCVLSLGTRLTALESALAKPPGKPDGERALVPGWFVLADLYACSNTCDVRGCDKLAVYGNEDPIRAVCEAHAAQIGVFAPPAPAESPGDGARCGPATWRDCSAPGCQFSTNNETIKNCRDCGRKGTLVPVPGNHPDAPAPAAPSAEAKTIDMLGALKKSLAGTDVMTGKSVSEAKTCEPDVWIDEPGCQGRQCPDSTCVICMSVPSADWIAWKRNKAARQLYIPQRDAGRPMRPATDRPTERCGNADCGENCTHGESVICGHEGECGNLRCEKPEPQPAAAPAPECAGPFVDARDCPVHDPRKAAAPAPVACTQAKGVSCDHPVCRKLRETASPAPCPAFYHCTYPELMDATDGACPAWWRAEAHVSKIWQKRLDEAQSVEAALRELVDDYKRAWLAKGREFVDQLEGCKRHCTSVEQEREALRAELARLRAPAGTGTNWNSRDVAARSDNDRRAHEWEECDGNPSSLARHDSIVALLDEAEARGREAALPEVAAWRALSESDRRDVLDSIATIARDRDDVADVTVPQVAYGYREDAKAHRIARRVLEALCPKGTP